MFEFHNSRIYFSALIKCVSILIKFALCTSCKHQILCRMLETVYVENSEQFLWENNEQFYLIKKTDFMNAVSKFEYTVNMMCREQILLI